MAIFKAGDKVYFPNGTSRIVTLVDIQDYFDGDYRLAIIEEDGSRVAFTEDGRFYKKHKLASIFHATKENQQLLEQLHGIELQEPPKPPTRREIIEAMLARGDECVPCWVSDDETQPDQKDSFSFISSINEHEIYVSFGGTTWRYATPFDPKTMQPITELPSE